MRIIMLRRWRRRIDRRRKLKNWRRNIRTRREEEGKRDRRERGRKTEEEGKRGREGEEKERERKEDTGKGKPKKGKQPIQAAMESLGSSSESECEVRSLSQRVRQLAARLQLKEWQWQWHPLWAVQCQRTPHLICCGRFLDGLWKLWLLVSYCLCTWWQQPVTPVFLYELCVVWVSKVFAPCFFQQYPFYGVVKYLNTTCLSVAIMGKYFILSPMCIHVKLPQRMGPSHQDWHSYTQQGWGSS